MNNVIDLVGQKFGRLTVIEKTERRSCNRSVIWRCLCDCGKETYVSTIHLRGGNTKSCGCFALDKATISATKHGKCNTRLYSVWALMKARCYNENVPAYKNYGARGISVCDEWHDPSEFINWAESNGYLRGLTLERINSNGNYEPNNCKWADRIEQNNNTRRNHIITYNGITLTMAQWARELGIKYQILCWRINKGHWNIERAFTEEVKAS